MITLSSQNGTFNFRAAAVILRRGTEVLVHRAPDDDFWTLPGGRVEMHESSADAVVREIREELGASSRVERTLWIIENFFRYSGVRCHEICFYHLVELAPEADALHEPHEFVGREPDIDTELIFRWTPIADLRTLDVLPSFLIAGLDTIPESVQHIVHEDANLFGEPDGLTV